MNNEINHYDNNKPKRKMTGILITLGVLLTTILAVFFLTMQSRGEKTDKDETEELEQVFAVNTTLAVQGNIKDYLYVNGDIIAKESADVYPDTSGKLTDIKVSLGDYVEKGDILLYIDPSRPGMKFSNSPVTSPISGTITSFPGTNGSTVTQQAPIATIGNLNKLQVRTFISERKISSIAMGMPATLSFEAYPGEVFIAEISELSPVIDPSSRTMEIKIDLLEWDEKIKSGMFTRIKITTSVKDKIVKIPTDCISERFGEKFVYLINDENVAIKTIIVEGISVNDISEILSGISPNDRIVMEGQSLLDHGAKVRIIKEIEPIAQNTLEEVN